MLSKFTIFNCVFFAWQYKCVEFFVKESLEFVQKGKTCSQSLLAVNILLIHVYVIVLKTKGKRDVHWAFCKRGVQTFCTSHSYLDLNPAAKQLHSVVMFSLKGQKKPLLMYRPAVSPASYASPEAPKGYLRV